MGEIRLKQRGESWGKAGGNHYNLTPNDNPRKITL